MKKAIWMISIGLFFFLVKSYGQEVNTNHNSSLPSLVAQDNFKPEILNAVVDKHTDTSAIIMLRIQKIEETVNGQQVANKYDLRICSLTPPDFAYFSFFSDRYFGYFNYRNHIVLVYGDNNIGYFFKKTTALKHFYFLAVKHHDDVNKPPVAIEPYVYKLDFLNGEFMSYGGSMLYGFHR